MKRQDPGIIRGGGGAAHAARRLDERLLRMQVVQTVLTTARPFSSSRTFCRFGINRRLVRLWAWLTA
jgi:hypothetical protein